MRLRFLTVFTAVMVLCQTAAYAAISTDADKYYIPWSFMAYEKPDFTSESSGLYEPREIAVLDSDDMGWGLAEVEGERRWVFLPDNRVYIDHDTPFYDGKNSGEAAGVLTPQVVKVMARSDEWMLIETWMGRKWIDPSAAKPEARLDIDALDQRVLGYPTGCEVVSLCMMISAETEADIDDLFERMPLSSDPERGFRGNPKTSGGFTILPPALLSLAKEYLGSAEDMTGSMPDDLRKRISDGKAVVVWVNGLGFNVHALCLTGYDEGGFYYNDPWRGSKDAYISNDSFASIWNERIYDSATGEYFEPRLALSY